MDSYRLHDGIEAAMTIVREANGYVDRSQPWKLAKDPEAAGELDAVLGSLVRALVCTAVALSPFMPGKCEEIWRRLGGDGELPGPDRIHDRLPRQIPQAGAGVLFPRLES
jgi:methionyl-tRNA synthetase